MFRRFQSRSLVLLYHRIAEPENDIWNLCVSPANFHEHLEVLRRHRVVRLDELKPGGRWGRPGLTCAITFDDGYADNLHEARCRLRSFDMPATFFVATGYVGAAREFWWDELERLVGDSRSAYLELYDRLRPLDDEARAQALHGLRPSIARYSPRDSHRPLRAQELAELGADDLFEIGAHTVTHPLLAAQAVEAQFREIYESKVWLETALGRAITSFSYPYGGSGHYGAAAVNAVREAGFTRACTTTPLPFSPGTSPWEIGRVVVPNVGGEEFRRLLFS